MKRRKANANIIRYLDLKMLLCLCLVLISLFTVNHLHAAEVVKNVVGKGEAVLSGITPEQARFIALQKARVDAIEQAAGVKIQGVTLIKDAIMVGQFLNAYAGGRILDERQNWTDERIPQKDGPPIFNYKVEITVSVAIPSKSIDQGFWLDARLNTDYFLAGDKATITLEVSKKASIAVFNLRADDRMMMLYPDSDREQDRVIEPKVPFQFPPPDLGADMVMSTLKGHDRHTELFMVLAVPVQTSKPIRFLDYFRPNDLYTVTEFYKRYNRFAEQADEKILIYEVRNKQEKQ